MTPGLPGPPQDPWVSLPKIVILSKFCVKIEQKRKVFGPQDAYLSGPSPPGSAPNIVFSIILILLLQHWALETLRHQFLGHEVSF